VAAAAPKAGPTAGSSPAPSTSLFTPTNLALAVGCVAWTYALGVLLSTALDVPVGAMTTAVMAFAGAVGFVAYLGQGFARS
jgi:hypothetical protein